MTEEKKPAQEPAPPDDDLVRPVAWQLLSSDGDGFPVNWLTLHEPADDRWRPLYAAAAIEARDQRIAALEGESRYAQAILRTERELRERLVAADRRAEAAEGALGRPVAWQLLGDDGFPVNWICMNPPVETKDDKWRPLYAAIAAQDAKKD